MAPTSRIAQRLLRRLFLVAFAGIGAWLLLPARSSAGAPAAAPKAAATASGPSILDRLANGQADGIDYFIAVAGFGLVLAFAYIVFSYVRGLKGSPRELYLLFFTKVTEYSAYGAAQMAFVLYLHNDVGLSDMAAGSYIGAWSVGLTLLTMLVGAVCDTIGIKKTLLLGCFALLFARFFMPLLSDIAIVSILGFIPLAVGIAITGPVLSVGIKKYTTRESAALGFALFYTMMNVGWAIGGWIFDFIRGIYGDKQIHVMPLVGEISTYQIIIAVGFFLTLPDLIAISLMRENVEMTEEGVRVRPREAGAGGATFKAMIGSVGEAGRGTVRQLKNVVVEKAFWIFIALIGVLVFVRLTFYHFHFTFPTYGIRVFGEGVKVGNIYGVLNPVMIVFLVPLVGTLTKKVRSYWMLLIGTTISAGAVFIATAPVEWFAPLVNTAFGELVYGRWLGVPEAARDPFYLAMIVFIAVFTVGEAIWSPRLMQFTAEIAPKGKEGSYIALSYLPYFGAKFIAGPMSGALIAGYVPEGGAPYTNHFMVWVWIGLMASLSPVGLLVLRRYYRQAETSSTESLAASSAEVAPAGPSGGAPRPGPAA